MVSVDDDQFHLTAYPANLEIFQSVGLGPGIGTGHETVYMVKNFLENYQQSLVLDADALNIISKSPELLSFLTPHTIITPHPKEFDRLFGHNSDEISRFETAKKWLCSIKSLL